MIGWFRRLFAPTVNPGEVIPGVEINIDEQVGAGDVVSGEIRQQIQVEQSAARAVESVTRRDQLLNDAVETNARMTAENCRLTKILTDLVSDLHTPQENNQ